MKAWKVFRVESGTSSQDIYMSCLIRGKAEVEYVRGEKNYAPQWLTKEGYHLLVFKTKEQAESFKKVVHRQSANISIQIFTDLSIKETCQTDKMVIKEVEIGPLVPLPSRLDSYSLKNGLLVARIERWPDGTLMTEWIKFEE